jgi:hypothetical protein
MDKKNYLTSFRDEYIDKPWTVFMRYIRFLAITLAIYMIIDGENYLGVAIGSSLVFISTIALAVAVNKKWPKRTTLE